jgi:sulfur-carrier protein
MIRVLLPAPLRALGGIEREVTLDVQAPATPRAVIDVIEARWPALRGTLRDPASGKRRALVRFYACGKDLSHDSPETPLPEAVAAGREPLLIIGAIAGG